VRCPSSPFLSEFDVHPAATNLENLFEYKRLQLGRVNADRSATNLDAVQYKVIMLTSDLLWLPMEKGQILRDWGRKWMMRCGQAIAGCILCSVLRRREKWESLNPQKVVLR